MDQDEKDTDAAEKKSAVDAMKDTEDTMMKEKEADTMMKEKEFGILVCLGLILNYLTVEYILMMK